MTGVFQQLLDQLGGLDNSVEAYILGSRSTPDAGRDLLDTLRAKIVAGSVVLVPPPASFVATTASASILHSSASPIAGGEAGRSGLPASLHFNVSPGDQHYAIAEFPFYGRHFGLALMERPQSSGVQFFDVDIDMRCYPGRKLGSRINGDAQAGSVLAEGVTIVPIATDLSDHVHTARIGCMSDTTFNNHLHVLGLYLDANHYKEALPAALPSEPVALTVASSATPDMTTEGTLLPIDPPAISSPSVAAGAERRYRAIECVEFIGGSSDSDVDLYQLLADGTWVRRWRASKDAFYDGVPALGTVMYKPVERMAMGTAFKAIIPYLSNSGVKVATWGATR